MPAGCPEKFDLAFLLWIWNYPTRTRRKVIALLQTHRTLNGSSVRYELPNKQLQRTVMRHRGAPQALRFIVRYATEVSAWHEHARSRPDDSVAQRSVREDAPASGAHPSTWR